MVSHTYALPTGAPKQQHYIPQAYSKRFANQAGLLTVYDFWDGGRAFFPGPRTAFKAKGLYNQPVHAERRVDASLEIFFSKVEDRVPRLVERLEAKEALDQKTHIDIIESLHDAYAGSKHIEGGNNAACGNGQARTTRRPNSTT